MNVRASIEDLVGIPYRFGGTDPSDGVDCLWTSRAALARIFPDFDPCELPSGPDEEEVALERVRAGASRWQCIGASAFAARRVGDLLHGRREDGGAFVAVLVDQVGCIAISALPDTGSRCLPLRRLAGVHSVYRRKP